ncbi:MAG: glycosyltransferase family 2 protein [Bacteroidales bacterium]|nr:glycosyltransferase family 2 protein [Bacteroidales bacterium]
MPKVSIIIPVFNMEAFLPRCLDSILGQSFRDVEIVAVDDCSTDGSVGVLESYQAADPRVKVVEHPVNRGTMWARESGIESATGDYFLFVDPDDAIRPETCSISLEKAVKEDADLVVFGYEHVLLDGSSEVSYQRLPYGSTAHDVIKALLSGDSQCSLSAKLFRRDLVESYNHLHIAGYIRSQDAAAMCIISPHVKKACMVDSPFYIYYQVSGSATNKRMSVKALENIMWTNTFRLESVREYDDLRSEAEGFCAHVLFNMVKNGYDRKVVRDLAKKNNLWRFVSPKSLIRNIGPRKAITYWLVTHVDGVASVVYSHKSN